MSTDSTTHEAIKLDPASNDDALRLAAAIRSVCDIDGRWDAAEILQALATPPLSEEPPEHSVVRAGSYRLYRDDIDPAGTPYRRVWFVMYGPDFTREWLTWPEVCALGTPEVLEPESVKALQAELLVLREQVAKKAPEHDEDCEAEYETGAHAWTPCGCWASRAEVKGLADRAERDVNAWCERWNTGRAAWTRDKGALVRDRDEARATLDQVGAEFRKAFTVDFGGWDWRDDDAIQTLARALSRLLSDKPANGDDEPPALEAS